MKNINYIAMDVHKEKIVVAESRKKGYSEFIGEYLNTDSSIKKMMKTIKKTNQDNEIKICYEAGPCGYAVKRILDKNGFKCEIVAPSLIPTKSGNRIKTDRRDAKKLARYYRAEELTMVHVPNKEQEAVRDLVRCRDDLSQDIRRFKQRIGHFLLRHGLVYPGKSNWTEMYKTWIKRIKFENEELQTTLKQYMNTLELLEIQIKDLTEKMLQIAQTEIYKEKVDALIAYKGIGVLTAMIIITEVVDFRRFRSPKELMSYLGLVPSEHSSGTTKSRGQITKCGNIRVRKALVESAWHYPAKPLISKTMKMNLEAIPTEFRQSPLKAVNRLNKRFYHLIYKGKSRQKAIIAIARELSGFIWSTLIKIEGEKNALTAT